jgi:hypothetical protein
VSRRLSVVLTLCYACGGGLSVSAAVCRHEAILLYSKESQTARHTVRCGDTWAIIRLDGDDWDINIID